MDFLIWPFVGFIEAIAALLWPSKDAKTRRLQRAVLVLVVIGSLLSVAGVVLLCYWSAIYALAVLASGLICIVASGALGNYVEERCKRETDDDAGK